MSVSIRRARRQDIDTLLSIESAAFTGDRLSRRSFHRHVESETASLLVAEAGGQIAGYALLFHRRGGQSARLYSIAVSEPFKAKGIGRALLEATEAQARALRRSLLTLEVREDNDRAAELYRKAGYAGAEKIANYYEDGAPALRLRKSLESKS